MKAVARTQTPLDLNRWSTLGANNLARHDCAFGIGLTAGRPESFTAILRKSLTIRADDVILEELNKLLLFGFGCNTPVRAENKSRDSRNVEILLQQLVKERLFLSGCRVGPDQFERLVAEDTDKLGWTGIGDN